MGLCIGVVLPVHIGEVGAEAGGCEHSTGNGDVMHRSLRSTGEQLSNMSAGSLRMAFQLPTPHCCRVSVHGLRCCGRTVLQLSTSIHVSSSDHFLHCFLCMTKASWSAILRILPLHSGMFMWVPLWNVQAGTNHGNEGRERETWRWCFKNELNT